MHLLLPAIGTAGDVFPLLGLGAELRLRGHRVTLATNEQFEPQARDADLEFISLGSRHEYRRLLEDPRTWDGRTGWPLFVEQSVGPAIERVYRAIESQAAAGDVVVVSSPLAVGARLAHEKLGVPHATFHIAPWFLRSCHDAPVLHPLFFRRLPAPCLRFQYWLADVIALDKALVPRVNAFRSQLGLGPLTRWLHHDWIYGEQLVIAAFPAWFGAPQPDWPKQTRMTGFLVYDGGSTNTASPELKQFLAEGDPPIVFTPGSGMLDALGFFREAAEACRLLGRRGLLMTTFPEQVPTELPPGVRRDHAPFTWLLPQVAALVHHGGIGTTARALASGIPQLVMPMVADQQDNALRVTRLGVGETIARSSFRAGPVAERLKRLLSSPRVAQSCREVRERFQGENPLQAACQLVEELAEKRSPARAANPTTTSRS